MGVAAHEAAVPALVLVAAAAPAAALWLARQRDETLAQLDEVTAQVATLLALTAPRSRPWVEYTTTCTGPGARARRRRIDRLGRSG